MKRFLISMLVFAVVIVSCSKDQQIVRKLEGEWKVTEIKYNGVSADASTYENTTYTFESCKVSKEDCSGTMEAIDGTKGLTSFPFTYSISEKGTQLTINLDILGFTTTTVSEILESSSKKFVWSSTEDGVTTETTIEPK